MRLASPGGGAAFDTSGLVGEGRDARPGGGAVAVEGRGDVTVCEAVAPAAAAAYRIGGKGAGVDRGTGEGPDVERCGVAAGTAGRDTASTLGFF